MKQPGETAAHYLELFENYAILDNLAAEEQDPAALGAIQDSIDSALLQMEFFEEDPTTLQELEAVDRFVPPVDAQVERRRQQLIDLLNSPDKHQGPITPASIQAKLDALPVPEDYHHQTRDLAHYLIGNVIAVQSDTESIATSSVVADSETPAPVAEGELERTPLSLKLYTGDLVLEYPDGTVQPFRREVDTARFTDAEEQIIADYRLGALQYIIAHPTDSSLPKTIWDSLNPPIEFTSTIWTRYIGDFLAEMQYDGHPLINIDNSVPRRRFYSLGNYDITLESTEEASGIEPATFALPNGDILAGREAKTMRLLLASSEDEPLTRERFDEAGVLSAEEIASIKGGDYRLSATVSLLRRTLQAAGADTQYIIRSVRDPERRTKSNRPETNYWIEVIDQSPELRDDRQTLRDAAQYLALYAEAIADLGLKPLDQKTLELLTARSDSEPTDDPTILYQAFEKALGLEFAERILNSFAEDSQSDDPEMILLDLLFKFIDDGDMRTALNKAISQTEIYKENAPSYPPQGAESASSSEPEDIIEMFTVAVTPVIQGVLETMEKHDLLGLPTTNREFLKRGFPDLTFRRETMTLQKAMMSIVTQNPAIRKQLDEFSTRDTSEALRNLGRLISEARRVYLEDLRRRQIASRI